MGRMDAADALDEIALLLERELASSYKSKAFRKAADVVRGMPRDELAARIADGKLSRAGGIGETTYAVIVQASRAASPTTSPTCASRRPAPRRRGGSTRSCAATCTATRLVGRHDEHRDDGTAAANVGLEYVAITDHSPSLRVANGLTAERLDSQLEILEALDGETGIRS